MLFNKLFPSRNQRVLRRFAKAVTDINALESQMQAFSDEQLAAKTDEFKKRYQEGETLDQLLTEAFAVVREAAVRTLHMRHFDVQLLGGMVLHKGKISEMRTGEGKTLVATLPAYLNALSGQGVHIVTVNDYLAKRDSEWMKPIYQLLGLTVSVVLANMDKADKQTAYQADIVYGTNNEFGFDYLRDNMAFSLPEKVQHKLNFAIVDEVDSILIDEARTPLIISGAAEDSSELYIKVNRFIPQLKKQLGEESPGDYTVDEKQRQVYLTENGHQHVEKLMSQAGLLREGESLYSAVNISLMHHVNAALRAYALYHKDVDYLISDNEILIIDEHTGRAMPGRRWSEGLHQAVEAKEGVPIQNENQTLASITFQNYFRLYNKLAGMTGTADTEAYEFQQIYNLEVVVVPTNQPMIRDDQTDQIYLNKQDKYSAIIADIKECQKRQQPVLLGTVSIETSELMSRLLNKEKIPHQVLNAKFHAKEAVIVAEAGRPGMVTIATNMAGRGTDIVLGGNLEAELRELGQEASPEDIIKHKEDWQKRHDQVVAAGGLRIIGSERHESRRIDNQLRGRAGRQGDPGSSRFYLSLEDNLLRIFASERVSMIMQKLGMQEGEAIEHRWVNRAIENAQRKVEGRNFEIRKQLLEYDNVANEQRKAIYGQRTEWMAVDDLTEEIKAIRLSVIQQFVGSHIPVDSLEEQWQIDELQQQLANDFNLHLDIKEWLEEDHHLGPEDVLQRITTAIDEAYLTKQQEMGLEVSRKLEKAILLQALDLHWREDLVAMDHLRQGIHLRGYAHRDPKQEYKREAFNLFATMLDALKYEVVTVLSTAQLQKPEDIDVIEEQRRAAVSSDLELQHESTQALVAEQDMEQTQQIQQPFIRQQPKVGRNESCPCGSGKKYKYCHGRL